MESVKKIITRTFVTICVLFAIVMVVAPETFTPMLRKTQTQSQTKDPQGSLFQKKWELDVDKMASKNMLPPEWDKVKTVKAIIKSDALKEWKSQLVTPIDTSSDGTHHMEILFYSWQDEEDGHLVMMVQYSLYDIESTRLIWEQARNIELN